MRFGLRVTLLAGWLAGAFAAGALLDGCFSPLELPCAFSCAKPPHTCPADYTCGTDRWCHRNGSVGSCEDAGVPDASTSDGSASDGAASD